MKLHACGKAPMFMGFVTYQTIIAMKLTVLFTLAACLQVNASLTAQKVTISKKNVSLIQVFREIRRQTGYTFFYSDRALELAGKVDIDVKGVSVGEALDQCFKQQPLSYAIQDKLIIVSIRTTEDLPREEQIPRPLPPPVEVSGRVTDEEGRPLERVSVSAIGTSLGVATDANGNFRITVADDAVLRFSYVGYEVMDVPLKKQRVISVVLKVKENAMKESVVVAYGTQKKESVTAAISTVQAKELKNPTQNLSQSIAGRVAGIIAVQRSGEPGGNDNAQFWIRGISTFGAGSSPLVLVDGVERPLNNLDPEEIENFSVLKDAAATAVYGIRGANGVVLITTRRGTNARPAMNFKYERGVSGPTRLPKLTDGPTYMTLYNEAYINKFPGQTAPYSDDLISKTKSGADPYLYPNVDWTKLMVKDWSANEHANLNISGGSPAAKYFVSASYYNLAGIWKQDGLNNYNTNANNKRYNFRANTDINLNKETILSLGLGGNLNQASFPGTPSGTIWSRIMQNNPVNYAATYPIAGGGYVFGLLKDGDIPNPYGSLVNTGYQTFWQSTLNSDISIKHDLSYFVQGLKVEGKFAFDAISSNSIQRTRTSGDRYHATGRDSAGNLILQKVYTGQKDLSFSKAAGGNRRVYVQADITYERTFGEHAINALLLYNQQNYQTADATTAELSLPYKYQGLVGRVSYNYAHRYFLELTTGYNGSENFPPHHRFGFFPSIAGGYIISDEPFVKNLKIDWLDFLKFRGSYGFKGNDQIGGRRFAYRTTVGGGNGGWAFGDNRQTSYDGRGEDQWGSDLTWEKENEIDLGLESRFLKSFYIQLDVFKRHRSGIFLQRILPTFIGMVNTPYGNVGEMDNKGFEATLEYKSHIGKLEIALRGNVTFARNKIIYNEDPPKKYPYQDLVGKRYGQPFGLIALGYYTKDDFNPDGTLNTTKLPATSYINKVYPGDLKYKDVNGDGVIDDYDKVAIGNPANPELVYGFGTTLSWNGIDLSVFFQGAGNMSFMLGGVGWTPFITPGAGANTTIYVTDRWTPDNPNPHALFPRLCLGGNPNNDVASTWWQRDAGYLRLKTAEIGYTLPRTLTSKLKIQAFRIYVSGMDLFTLSKFKYWDPELGNSNGAVYPIQRTVNFGVNINF